MTTAHISSSVSSSISSDSNLEAVGSSTNMPPPPVNTAHFPSPRLQSSGNRLHRDSSQSRDRSSSYGNYSHYSTTSLPHATWTSSNSPSLHAHPSPRTSSTMPALPPLSPVPPFYTGDDDAASFYRMTSTPIPLLDSSQGPHLSSFPSPTNSHLVMKQAVESALSTERTRIRTLEEAEASLTLEELRHVLKKERLHSLHLTGELAAIKSALVTCQAEAEIHEEGRINTLMRRVHTQMESMQREKERIIVELEREEEMLTNTLQKKLEEVRREKEMLQRKIEQEHLFNEELRAKLDSLSESSSTLTSLEDTRNDSMME
jgi:hypothetical protein